MATLSVQSVVRAGMTPSYASAGASGDVFAWSQNAFLHVKNGSASSITVTIASQLDPAPVGAVAQDLTVTIGAGAEKMIGPFYAPAYKNADGNVEVTYSDTTTVTVAALTV